MILGCIFFYRIVMRRTTIVAGHWQHARIGGGMGGTYVDLEVWRAAMELVTRVYELSRAFPKDEMYGLTSQIRHAVVSVPSNVAEGKGRASDKELTQFLCHARGSLLEVATQLGIAERLAYITKEEAEPLRRDMARVGQMLNGLIRSVRSPLKP